MDTSAGGTIIAHSKTAKHLAETTRVDDWNYTFDPLPKGALPAILVDSEHALHFNNEHIAIRYYSPSHTDGDLSVHFEQADILHTGDTWWNGYFPFIDYNTGGSIDGAIKAAEWNAQKVTDKTVIIPGHGPVGEKKQLLEFVDMLHTVRKNVPDLKQQGRTLQETIAAKPTKAYDAKWGGFVINGDFFTNLVYRGV
jgi:glyoxylase-like metal-dependent hydrolase (beta-lactamase superfamily II)